MGVKLVHLSLFILLGLPGPSEPLQERMKTWRLKHRHPHPRYLRVSLWEENPSPVKWKVYGYPSTIQTYQGLKEYTVDVLGRTWEVPDPAAQIDEVRANLYDEAVKGGYNAQTPNETR